MVQSQHIFGQARLKHIWAEQHINHLHAEWDAFLETDFCELRVEDNGHGGEHIRVVSLKMLSAAIPLTIGDAVHNLKAALDYVIAELLGWHNTRLTFPMGETREELVSSFSTNGLDPCPACKRGGKGKGRNAAIETAIPGMGGFIVDEIRPYKAEGGFLWPLNKLDVRDKHRLLLPIVVPQTISGINAVDENDCGFFDMTVQLSAGGTFTPFNAGQGLKIQSYGKPTAEIFFNEIGVVEKQPVFPTLLQMSHAVSETIDRIEQFALNAGWQPQPRN